jgi:hypothetical protein
MFSLPIGQQSLMKFEHGTILIKWNTCDVFINEVLMEDEPL